MKAPMKPFVPLFLLSALLALLGDIVANPTTSQATAKAIVKPVPVISYAYKAELVKVVDGDTIDVRIDLGFNVWTVQRLRLLNTYAAEHNDTGGKKHTENLQVLLKGIDTKHALLVQTIKDKRDKYGRMLADIWVGQLHINSTQMAFIGAAQGKGLSP